MRLWPLCIIDQLPRQQLLGQHRECCALRGKGWGRKHSTVDYVFCHHYEHLALYHRHILWEMVDRGYCPNEKWWDSTYRGENLPSCRISQRVLWDAPDLVYPEHDENYLDECIANLAMKGVTIDRKRAIERLNAA